MVLYSSASFEIEYTSRTLGNIRDFLESGELTNVTPRALKYDVYLSSRTVATVVAYPFDGPKDISVIIAAQDRQIIAEFEKEFPSASLCSEGSHKVEKLGIY